VSSSTVIAFEAEMGCTRTEVNPPSPRSSGRLSARNTRSSSIGGIVTGCVSTTWRQAAREHRDGIRWLVRRGPWEHGSEKPTSAEDPRLLSQDVFERLQEHQGVVTEHGAENASAARIGQIVPTAAHPGACGTTSVSADV
jgi:hypothetical protein